MVPSENVTVTLPGPEFTVGFDVWHAVHTRSPGAPECPWGAPAERPKDGVAAANVSSIPKSGANILMFIPPVVSAEPTLLTVLACRCAQDVKEL